MTQTSLASNVLRAGNSPQALQHLSAVSPALPATPNAGISPPVLACNARDFIDQTDLEYQWSALLERLKTTTLSEQEVLAILSSGILQTDTGKVISDLFADAMLRSIHLRGTLNAGNRKEIVDVLCHLPPSQWQAAFGENARFASGPGSEGVAGFIQSQLDRSGALRDERIANDELLTDSQWEALKNITLQARQYIHRSSESQLNSALIMLEDAHDLRPSPKDARMQLARFIEELEQPVHSERVRWQDRFVNDVKSVYDQFKPVESVEPTWQEWINGPGWQEMFGRPVSSVSSASSSSSKVGVGASPLSNGSSWLLSALQTFERSADFYSNVTLNGPNIPKSWMGTLLYVCNALHILGVLKLDNSHISTSRPASAPGKPATEGGIGDLRASPPVLPGYIPENTATLAVPSLATLEQFAAQADDVITRFINSMTPWDSAYAQDLENVVVILRRNDPLNDVLPSSSLLTGMLAMEGLGEQLRDWLNRMSGNLLSTGVAVLSRTGDLIERNPRSAMGVFAAYMAISNLYASWFLPESPMQNSPVDPTSDFYFVPDPAVDIHDLIQEAIDFFLEEFPALSMALNVRVNQSTYADPHLDSKLLEDVEELLRKPTPDNPDVTYQERIEEIILLAELDEQDEIDGYADSVPPTVFLDAASESSQQPSAPETKVLIRNVRSTGASVPSITFEKVPAPGVHLIIENIRESKMEKVSSFQEKDEIAPGITIDQATDKVIDAFKAAEAIVDPQSFIQNSVNTIISESSLPDFLKAKLNHTSTIEVEFKEIKLPDRSGISKRAVRIQTFTLAELCTDYHLRVQASNEGLNILWPTGFTESFKNTIINADLQGAYKESVKSTLERPDVKELWVLSKQYELKIALESYKNSNTASAEGKAIADSFIEGKTRSHIIYLNNPREKTPAKVSNAIYLGGDLEGAGLFVFLGGDNAVIELPAGSKQKQEVIENNNLLQRKLLDRIPLYEKLLREDNDFKYSEPVFEIFSFYPRYAPVLFESSADALDQLYKRQLEQVLSDIDTLVSTDEERFTDGLIAAIGNVLTAMSIVTILPGATVLATKGARMAASFLFGASASSTELIRGSMADDPDTAKRYRSNAFRGFIMEFAGPLAGRLLGKAFSNSVASRIARSVFNRFKAMGHRLPRPIKWIPPAVKNPEVLIAKMESKFKSHRTVSHLQKLDRGPDVAQKLIKDTKIIYFSGPGEGYIYQGFVMRGDMRPPTVVFEKGFKLRTPITDVNQVNGMRGGFGGGKNALDMDGMGISTSPYYKNSGAGAFQYGGGRGGYTYVVDARQMRGYHLYANDHWKKYPDSKLGMRPYEVNYGQDIPASAVIGCYDKQGKFTPNPLALQNSIDASRPFQLPEGVFYRPFMLFDKQVNATSVS